MKTFRLVTKSVQETMRFGERLAKQLKAGDVVALFGDLGSGKTTLVKGIAKGLKVKTAQVNSPTFVLMNVYEGKLPIYHFDLYRLEDTKEIDRLGCDEFFYDKGIAIIEWAERLKELLPKEYLGIELTHKNEKERALTLTAHGERYLNLLRSILPPFQPSPLAFARGRAKKYRKLT